MKTTTFIIDLATAIFNNTTNEADFKVDILPAFAIENCYLSVNGINYYTNFSYNNDIVHWNGDFEIDTSDEVILTISYFGIRDYQLLFPWIADTNLRVRLGEFYSEAELNFENCCWLSYALMCGAIYEGILFAKYRRTLTYNQLINFSFHSADINLQTKNIMEKTREIRNLVHANNCTKPFVSRLNAMDMRTTMDSLIKNVR